MIETARLRLRTWQQKDLPHLAELCADAEVMRYFPSTLNEQQVRELFDKLLERFDKQGYGFWVAEDKLTGEFLGFIGLNRLPADNGILPNEFVEVGWRLKASCWGQGLAPEGALSALEYAKSLGMREIYAFTALLNTPSQRVMEKIGMVNTGMDFDHPMVGEGSSLRRHCLYRIEL